MTKDKILGNQISTDLIELSKDWSAGLHDTSGLLKALESIKAKALELEAHQDAISDIENNEPEMRSERQAGEVEQMRDSMREEQ